MNAPVFVRRKFQMDAEHNHITAWDKRLIAIANAISSGLSIDVIVS